MKSKRRDPVRELLYADQTWALEAWKAHRVRQLTRAVDFLMASAGLLKKRSREGLEVIEHEVRIRPNGDKIAILAYRDFEDLCEVVQAARGWLGETAAGLHTNTATGRSDTQKAVVRLRDKAGNNANP